jgi:hypothetical protein
MKKQKVVVLTEQDLSSIVKKVAKFLGGDVDDLVDKILGKKITGSSVKNVSSTDFEKVTNQIIDQLEGGYYHPDMLKDGRVKDSRYGGSGETMFGIDRKTGGSENTSAAGVEFWKLIDAENARKNWKHEYMLKDNPNLNKKLRKLVSQIMEPHFLSYQKRYLSPASIKVINSNPKLYYNWAYATWNGPGWFQRMAKDFNKKVEQGLSEKELVKSVLDWRKNSGNSLIAQGGRKMDTILSKMA